ncbi:MAG TPA: phosphopantetheine-binding protein [Pseudonocardiaceae bacterium]
MFEELKQLMASKYQLDPATITPDATLKGLGLDSLDVVELAMTAEKEWGPRVTDDELNEAQRLDAIVQLLESRNARV